MLSILAGFSTHVQAEDPARWDGISRIQIDLTSAAPTAPIPLNLPGTVLPTSEESAPRIQQVHYESAGQASSDATRNADINRAELRESLVRDGQNSLAGRDDLAKEVVSVFKWTFVVLVLGGAVAFGLKKYDWAKTAGVSGQQIRVIETLSLGRQQGLKLIEVSGERFLVACDQSGIKSVNMMHNWPAMDQDEPRSSSSEALPEFTRHQQAA